MKIVKIYLMVGLFFLNINLISGFRDFFKEFKENLFDNYNQRCEELNKKIFGSDRYPNFKKHFFTIFYSGQYTSESQLSEQEQKELSFFKDSISIAARNIRLEEYNYQDYKTKIEYSIISQYRERFSSNEYEIKKYNYFLQIYIIKELKKHSSLGEEQKYMHELDCLTEKITKNNLK